MSKKAITFGLSPVKMAELLRIGSQISKDEKEIDQDLLKTELLNDRLKETLPLDKSMLELLPSTMIHLCNKLGVLAGEPIGNLLQNPHAKILIINKLKDYSKTLTECAKSEAENDTSVALYYAAIASALVFHDTRITKFSFESLNQALCSLIDKPWMPERLILLFKQAREICISKLQDKNNKDKL